MQLYLVRHADSNFDASSDHQRPLSALGMRQAAHSATYLKKRIHTSDSQIICSDALRTETTALIIQQQIDPSNLSTDNRYYHARVGDWCDAIMTHSSLENLILVGHNPTISFLSKYLNPSNIQSFSPSCVAHYQLEINSDGLKLPVQFIDYFKPDAI